MNTKTKKQILDVLNNLEIVEEGSEGYILVENSPEVHEKLNALGVSSEIINKYGDDETFCIITLAFTEKYANEFLNGKLVWLSQLRFAKEDKTLSDGGWILDYEFLKDIHEKISSLSDETLHTDMENIEAVLLVANGEEELLKQRLAELEDF